MLNLNPTIHKIKTFLSHQPATEKELSETIGIPLGNVRAILIASKWAHFNGEKWELIQ